jgi:hypothetical protein
MFHAAAQLSGKDVRDQTRIHGYGNLKTPNPRKRQPVKGVDPSGTLRLIQATLLQEANFSSFRTRQQSKRPKT